MLLPETPLTAPTLALTESTPQTPVLPCAIAPGETGRAPVVTYSMMTPDQLEKTMAIFRDMAERWRKEDKEDARSSLRRKEPECPLRPWPRHFPHEQPSEITITITIKRPSGEYFMR